MPLGRINTPGYQIIFLKKEQQVGIPSINEPHASRKGVLQRLLAAESAAFILTILMMVAVVFQNGPPKLLRFFDDRGVFVLAVEVGFILATALVLIVAERRQSLREIHQREAALLEGPTSRSSCASEEQMTNEDGNDRSG